MGRIALVVLGGGDNDILISNRRVSAVIDALDAPIDLAPTGGNVIDLDVRMPVAGPDPGVISPQAGKARDPERATIAVCRPTPPPV